MGTLPENASQWLALIGPLITILIGLGYFAAPLRMFNHLKLAGAAGHPEAFGEARSSFAGFLLATGLLALVTREPAIFTLLATAWALTALGKLIHIAFDKDFSRSVVVRLVMAILLAVICFYEGGVSSINLEMPVMLSSILPAISALMTLVFGLLCFFMPKTSLSIMRLATIEDYPQSAGEIRGTLAGFYLAAAFGVLLFGGGVYALLFLGFGWVMSGFGRMISMLSDGTNNFFNWISLLIEMTLAALPLAAVMGLFG